MVLRMKSFSVLMQSISPLRRIFAYLIHHGILMRGYDRSDCSGQNANQNVKSALSQQLPICRRHLLQPSMLRVLTLCCYRVTRQVNTIIIYLKQEAKTSDFKPLLKATTCRLLASNAKLFQARILLRNSKGLKTLSFLIAILLSFLVQDIFWLLF